MDRKKSILVVEDEGLIAADLQKRLERMGYSVSAVARSGQEALDFALQQPVDLVLMDIRLQHEMDGIETAQALRNVRDVPVIYLTAFGNEETLERAKKTDAFGYLLKPVRDGSLHATIELSLQKHDQEHHAAEGWRTSRQKCRILASRLNTAKEGECRRLARELHDDIQQRLSAIALELEIQGNDDTLPPKASLLLESVTRQVRLLSQDLRQISQRLYPQILQQQGLATALQGLCQGCAQLGLQVEFQHSGLPQVLSPDVAICLYRIAQEGLHNVRKHARTSHAAVTLEGSGTGVVLHISDCGAGFDPKAEKGESPLGLRSIADRVYEAGGTLKLVSEPGVGTEVTVYIPLLDDTP